MTVRVGLDFGTTNSALGVRRGDGPPSLASFALGGSLVDSFRSILLFLRDTGTRRAETYAGPAAIERYLGEEEGEKRLIQSVKTHLSSRRFQSTSIFGRVYRLEDLIAMIVRALKEDAEKEFGPLGGPVRVGRPVQFAGSDAEEDGACALDRLRRSIELAGFEHVEFEYEPVAAAHHYASGLAREERILIGDFGGGTSDFCLLEAGRREGATERATSRILGTAGVALAGDAFDRRFIRHLVAPQLGCGSDYRSFPGDKILPVPAWPYLALEQWHHLSFLKARKTMRMLSDIQAMALEREKIASFIRIVDHDSGYYLHQEVERTKHRLSAEPVAEFRFVRDGTRVEATVTRQEFEAWIEEDLERISSCLDGLLAATKVTPREVDAVFLTGGTAFVPAVRRIFESRFGPDRIRSGGEFTAVAAGLTL